MLEFVMRSFKPTVAKLLITTLFLGVSALLYRIWSLSNLPIKEFAPVVLGFPFAFLVVGPYDVCETCSVFHFILWAFAVDLLLWYLIASLFFYKRKK
jgi:hypothetical protein